MRIRSQVLDRRQATEMNLTPMIDVVFLLLIFFLWTSSFEVPEQLLPSSLYTAAGAAVSASPPPPAADLEQVVIRLYWQGGQAQWHVNDVPAASLAEVTAKLRGVAAVSTAVPLLIDPQDATPLEYVIQTYDAGREAGFEQIQFTAGDSLPTPPASP